MPWDKDRELARLAKLADEIQALEGQLTAKRNQRNLAIYEAATQHDGEVSISELAQAARVRHSYASRAVRGKGDAQEGRKP